MSLGRRAIRRVHAVHVGVYIYSTAFHGLPRELGNKFQRWKIVRERSMKFFRPRAIRPVFRVSSDSRLLGECVVGRNGAQMPQPET